MIRAAKNLALSIIIILVLLGIARIQGQAKSIEITDSVTLVEDTVSIDSIREDMISKVQSHIDKKAPKANPHIAMHLVDASMRSGIDLAFMMAQAEIETNYGTVGIGRTKKSIFGVMGRQYAHYQDAIDHYCEILGRSYLVNGRTEQHLMTKYTTVGGKRYAQNPNYEAQLRAKFNIIKKHLD